MRRRSWQSIVSRTIFSRAVVLGQIAAVVLMTATTANAISLVVMSVDTASVPGEKVFTIGVQVTQADLAAPGVGNNPPLAVQNLTFIGGANGPFHQSGATNEPNIQALQTDFIDPAAVGGPPSNTGSRPRMPYTATVGGIAVVQFLIPLAKGLLTASLIALAEPVSLRRTRLAMGAECIPSGQQTTSVQRDSPLSRLSPGTSHPRICQWSNDELHRIVRSLRLAENLPAHRWRANSSTAC